MNSAPSNLDFAEAGGVSRSILTRAGQDLEIDCRRKFKNGLPQGELIVTTGHNINQIKWIYHITLPKTNKKDERKEVCLSYTLLFILNLR